MSELFKKIRDELDKAREEKTETVAGRAAEALKRKIKRKVDGEVRTLVAAETKQAAIGKQVLKNLGIAGLGGAAVGVPAAGWYLGQAPSDPEAIDPTTGETKVTNLDKILGDYAVRSAIKRTKTDPDVMVDSGLHRVRIPKKKLKEEVLKYLQFDPSLIAVPEQGQDKLTTYRQMDTAAHLHSHGDDWLLHQDEYPALLSAIKNPKNKGKMREAISSGMKHVGLEGVRGYLDWFRDVFRGAPSFSDRVKAMENPKKYPEVIKWLADEERRYLKENLAKKASNYEELLVKLGDAELTVEVADDDEKRAMGMAGRDDVSDDRGMLFSPAGKYWMRGCTKDLDIMFIDKNAEVVDIQTMTCEEPDKVYASRSDTEPEIAIEVPAGWCDRHGVTVGAKLATPSTDLT